MHADQQVSSCKTVPILFKMLGILFLLVLSVNGNPTHPSVDVNLEFSCSDSRRPCILQDVVLLTEADLNAVSFPRISDPLTIASGRIPNFSRQLAEKLIDIVDLTINGLEVETLYVRPDMTHLEATRNRIHTLLVDNSSTSNPVYEMRTLDLTDNQLSNVAVLSRFVHLRRLKLDANKLTRLSMNVFDGMSELRELSIADNQLFSVDTASSFRLAKLKSLSLTGNQLLELDVSKWEFAALKDLDLSRNKLCVMRGELQQFEALKRARLAGNYWKCEVLMDLERMKLDADEVGRCEKKRMIDVRSICCITTKKEEATREVFDMYKDKWEDLRKLSEDVMKLDDWVAKHQKQADEPLTTTETERNLERRMVDFESELKKVSDKLNDRETVPYEESNKFVTSYSTSLDQLETKQSDLKSKTEEYFDNLDQLKQKMDAKLDTVDTVSKKVDQFEEQSKQEGKESALTSSIQLKTTIERLDNRLTKYYHSSLGLKNQIGKEGLRADELKKELEKLYNDLAMLNRKIVSIYRLSDEKSNE